MEPFDPANFDFALLRDFEIPGGVAAYERINHSAVDGHRDYLRLNIYLTKDNDYVTIWHGLLEPLFTEMELTTGRLAGVERPDDFDFLDSYSQDLFRGHIESADIAAVILKAIGIGVPGRIYAYPQVLRAGTDNTLWCDMLERPDDEGQAARRGRAGERIKEIASHIVDREPNPNETAEGEGEAIAAEVVRMRRERRQRS